MRIGGERARILLRRRCRRRPFPFFTQSQKKAGVRVGSLHILVQGRKHECIPMNLIVAAATLLPGGARISSISSPRHINSPQSVLRIKKRENGKKLEKTGNCGDGKIRES
jgi:hypothetical protein